MLKLLLCMFFSAVLGATLLELRQQHLELNFQTNKLHNEIEQTQAKLWNQQLQIAVYTAPNAISETVGKCDLNMVPQTPLPAEKANWIDPSRGPRGRVTRNSLTASIDSQTPGLRYSADPDVLPHRSASSAYLRGGV